MTKIINSETEYRIHCAIDRIYQVFDDRDALRTPLVLDYELCEIADALEISRPSTGVLSNADRMALFTAAQKERFKFPIWVDLKSRNNEIDLPQGQWMYIFFPIQNYWEIHGKESELVLEPTPNYCDRGQWVAKVEARGRLASSLDNFDGFPRYYFDLHRAKSELEDWLIRRDQISGFDLDRRNADEIEKLKQLKQVAIGLQDCLLEFPENPKACGEHMEALGNLLRDIL